MSSNKEIVNSWKANAGNWITTIENGEIESRQLATNDAVIKTVMEHAPAKVLDIGCGEGWLSRELRKRGIEMWGCDAIPELINVAKAKDGDFYFTCAYEEIISGAHKLPSPFDASVLNFSLIDKEVTEHLIVSLPSLLNSNGYLFIQTFHPLSVAASGPYVSGWKEGSWNGMKQNFVLPYEWYFRTLKDWIALFINAGFLLKEIKEPLHPQTAQPLSIIFVLQADKLPGLK